MYECHRQWNSTIGHVSNAPTSTFAVWPHLTVAFSAPSTAEQLASLPIIRFRPNIVLESEATIDGTPKLLPWEEDGFLELELFESGSDAKDIPFGQAAKGKGKLGISCMARVSDST